MSSLNDVEKYILEKAGKLDTTAIDDNLLYAGFNTYVSKDNHVFLKRGEELLEVTNEKIAAEQRFLKRHLKDI